MARAWYTSESFRKTALGLGAFLGVVILFWLLLRLTGFFGIYARVEAGVVRLGTGFGNAIGRLSESEAALTTKYESCQTDLRNTSQVAAQVSSLQTQVTELQSLIGYVESTGSKGLATHVIARAVDDNATRVLVDRGQLDGVVKGSAVVIDDGVLFGLVDQVDEHTSLVRLVTNADSRLPAAILGKQRTIGLVEGREGALLGMEFIPQEADLKAGDIVVTSGLDGLVKEGLVIGLVTQVESVESAPFQRAFIELLYEPRAWTTLLILPPPGL